MTRVRTGLRIPMELNTFLILEARKMGISKNALILMILGEYVKEVTKQVQSSILGLSERPTR